MVETVLINNVLPQHHFRSNSMKNECAQVTPESREEFTFPNHAYVLMKLINFFFS
jgi:hypothetical protein